MKAREKASGVRVFPPYTLPGSLLDPGLSLSHQL